MNPKLLATAVQFHQAGKLAEAEAIYRQILKENPNQIDALHLLGVICGQSGREIEGISLIQTAIAIGPARAAHHSNLGNILRQVGKIEPAIASFQRAVAMDPNHSNAWNNLGNALRDNRQFDQAIAAYERSLALKPDVAEVLSNLGITLRMAGRLDESITAHRRAIALAPQSSEAHNNLGVALRDQNCWSESLTAHQRAVDLNPRSVSALSNLGAALRKAGEIDPAIQTLHRALEIDPRHADSYNNLASALIDLGNFQEAAAACRKAIAFDPHHADAHGNLGIALAYEGEVDAALASARCAVRLAPGDPLQHWNLSMLLLLLGDFENGWHEHEWRWQCPSMLKPRQFSQPRWSGEELHGKTVLLFSEQGFGDMIQFIRFAPVVEQLGGHAIVECQPEMRRLFEKMPGISRCITLGEALPEFDLQCPLMSLPLAARNRLHAVTSVPYLRVPRSDHNWQIDPDNLNVGVAWSGNPKHQNDRNRSINFAELAPLLEIAGVTLHSLQKRPAPPPLIDHSQELLDFAATAQLIDQLDLVITVDTAVAHLAGAMAKPTWLLLPFMPDWRWMLHREDSEWYATMRLFRQTMISDWNEATQRIAHELAKI